LNVALLVALFQLRRDAWKTHHPESDTDFFHSQIIFSLPLKRQLQFFWFFLKKHPHSNLEIFEE
jgi:hypothetical protein